MVDSLVFFSGEPGVLEVLEYGKSMHMSADLVSL